MCANVFCFMAGLGVCWLCEPSLSLLWASACGLEGHLHTGQVFPWSRGVLVFLYGGLVSRQTGQNDLTCDVMLAMGLAMGLARGLEWLGLDMIDCRRKHVMAGMVFVCMFALQSGTLGKSQICTDVGRSKAWTLASLFALTGWIPRIVPFGIHYVFDYFSLSWGITSTTITWLQSGLLRRYLSLGIGIFGIYHPYIPLPASLVLGKYCCFLAVPPHQSWLVFPNTPPFVDSSPMLPDIQNWGTTIAQRRP